jgi:hypothetical protein
MEISKFVLELFLNIFWYLSELGNGVFLWAFGFDVFCALWLRIFYLLKGGGDF